MWLSWLLFAPLLSQVTATLPQTLQVNGISRDLTDAWSDPPASDLGMVRARVDLGRSADRPRPEREKLDRLTLLGTRGAAPGAVYDLRRVCDFLCGDEEEECHYEMTVAAQGEPEAMGTPLLALVGSYEVTDYRALSAVVSATPPDLLTRGFEPTVWPAPGTSGSRSEYRLRSAGEGRLQLEYRWSPESETYTLTGDRCETRSVGGLTRVDCASFVALAEGPRPLLVSFADYGAPAAEPLAEMRIDGNRALLVRLGLKAQTIYGLLVETEQGWVAQFDPRDYALLC